MAGTTTYYGISYPTSTDYVKDGATAMQTIADGFDSAVAIPTYNNQTGTSYTFVLADAGKTVTSNNASAVTFTIPPQTSVAWANNTTLTVRNLGAGVVTIAGGAGVTVTNTAQTVAQYGEVKLIRTASNAWTVTPAGGSSGLNLITSQSFTTAATVNVNDCFSSTYDAYRILFNGVGSASSRLSMRMRVSGSDNTSSNYGWNYVVNGTAGVGTNHSFTDTSWYLPAFDTARRSQATMDIINPFATLNTTYTNLGLSVDSTVNYVWMNSGSLSVTTSYTGFTIYPASGTITGFVTVYGYQK